MNTLRATITLVVLAIALFGCRGQRAPITVIAGADASGSARRHLSSYVQSLSTIGSALQPRLDTLFVFRYDFDAAEIFGPEPPYDPEDFTSSLVHRFSGDAPQRGTRPAEFLAAAARLAENATSPVTIICLTDGGNDDLTPAGQDAMLAVARDLAANPKVRLVLFAGCLPGTREKLRDLLKPLGRKLDFKEVAEVGTVIL